LLYRYLL